MKCLVTWTPILTLHSSLRCTLSWSGSDCLHCLHWCIWTRTACPYLFFLVPFFNPSLWNLGVTLPLCWLKKTIQLFSSLTSLRRFTKLGGWVPLSGNQTNFGTFKTVATTNSFGLVLWYPFWCSTAFLKCRMLATMSVLDFSRPH